MGSPTGGSTHVCDQVPGAFTVTDHAAEDYTFAHRGGTLYSTTYHVGTSVSAFGVWLAEPGDRRVTMSLIEAVDGYEKNSNGTDDDFVVMPVPPAQIPAPDMSGDLTVDIEDADIPLGNLPQPGTSTTTR